MAARQQLFPKYFEGQLPKFVGVCHVLLVIFVLSMFLFCDLTLILQWWVGVLVNFPDKFTIHMKLYFSFTKPLTSQYTFPGLNYLVLPSRKHIRNHFELTSCTSFSRWKLHFGKCNVKTSYLDQKKAMNKSL